MGSKKSFIKGALCGALTMLVIAGVGVGIFVIKDKATNTGEGGLVSSATEEKLQLIQEMIESKYLYGEDVDEDKLQESIIKGYVDGLGDPYSVYYNEAETRSLMESTSGEFGGIGVVITQNIDTQIITFTTVYENSPAEKAGMKSGDILYKVDGEEVTGQDLDTVVSKIRGEKGTTVEITVYRGDSMEEYTGVVTRDIIEVNTVAYEMKDNKIGYIAVSGFETVTYEQFEAALNDLTAQGMETLVIDLRNNPGGNLSTVCDMLDLILPEGTIVSTKDKNGNGSVITSDEEHQLNIPLAVLINGNSASASEIFAGAVQDFGIGILVGTTTYGKGIVQELYQMSDGTCLKITTSEYFTPSGRNIHGIGIEPDVKVEYEYDEANPDADNQLEAALKCLKEK
ncbi:MAG: S41 family peptidase [Tyzzerella sp.]|nr:S41 family peptidase [Tyzzerella sp.]